MTDPDPTASEGTYRPRDHESGALAGIRVVDLTTARSGPTCVRQLADMGADVVQVARPHRGDLAGSDSQNLHRNKRSIAVDLKSAEGVEVLLRLADRADVLVENYRADVKHRLGIDYESLAARNPRLVYASLSGFGQEGPYRDRPGLDQIAQGMGGLMSVTGPPGGGPWRAGIAISDTASGTFLALGVVSALFARERTGRGQWVHTSLLEAMVNFMDFQATRWLIDGEVPPQAGNDHPTVFPMGTFATADGHINVAPMMRWERFLDAIEAPGLADDSRFDSGEKRNQNRDELRAAIEAKLVARTSAEWIEILGAADMPVGPILSVDEVFDDPQVRHLQITRRVTHATDGDVELLRLPLTFSETPAGVRSAAPLAGGHGAEILDELGYGSDEIEALFAGGAVAKHSAPRGWGDR